MTLSPLLPQSDCPKCPRLAAFRANNKQYYPDFFNGAVPSFGTLSAQLLIVGLAPGLKGANARGRPFTGDYAGDVLYLALQKHGFTLGEYDRRADDGFELKNCRITNAVRCVPPDNKPETDEIKQCNGFLKAEIAAMPQLRVIVSLGTISHKAVLVALGEKLSAHPFVHGEEHAVGKLLLLNSYHTSRYNVNTGRLTQEMFESIIGHAKSMITQHKDLS